MRMHRGLGHYLAVLVVTLAPGPGGAHARETLHARRTRTTRWAEGLLLSRYAPLLRGTSSQLSNPTGTSEGAWAAQCEADAGQLQQQQQQREATIGRLKRAASAVGAGLAGLPGSARAILAEE